MAFVRVEFSTDGITFVPVEINPLEADLQSSDDVNSIQTLDGSTIEQLSSLDTRPRTLTWRNLPQKVPYTTMVDRLKTYKNIGPIWIRLNRIDFDNTTEVRIKVTNVITSIRSGAGPSTSPYKMTYSNVILEYVRVKV